LKLPDKDARNHVEEKKTGRRWGGWGWTLNH